MRSVIDSLDLSVEEIEELMTTATDMADHPENYTKCMEGKILSTMFFEPSTRTRLSFESAMYALGGQVISMSQAASASTAKGESIADTARTVSCYADILAMRHPLEGSSLMAAASATIPVINAGDGGHCHPTQTLADMLTIYREKGRFDHLTVGVCGDLKYGRTVHSLIGALSRYKGMRFILISPEQLKVRNYVKKNYILESGNEYRETTSLEDVIGDLDILYMTRIQRERFDDPQEYEALKDSYILDTEKMKKAKSDCIIMHPLPRVNEISVGVDKDPRACYFKQVLNGKYMRMALILKLVKDREQDPVNHTVVTGDLLPGICKNPKCISSTEQEIPTLFKMKNGKCRCVYCETVRSE